MAAAKKPKVSKSEEAASAPLSGASDEPKPVVVSDVVTETTERVEVIEETSEAKSEADNPAESAPAESPDPLTDFKEKMIEEEKDPLSDMGPKKNYMWPILFIFIIALLLLGGIFVYKQGMNKGTQVNVVTLTPTPTVIPKPTKPIDLTKYEIQILNGSEVDGEAGRQRNKLEGEGFIVSSVGNADKSDYTKTIIQVKENVDKDFLGKLKSVLEESFVVGEIEELPEDSDSDVIVILGSQVN